MKGASLLMKTFRCEHLRKSATSVVKSFLGFVPRSLLRVDAVKVRYLGACPEEYSSLEASWTFSSTNEKARQKALRVL